MRKSNFFVMPLLSVEPYCWLKIRYTSINGWTGAYSNNEEYAVKDRSWHGMVCRIVKRGSVIVSMILRSIRKWETLCSTTLDV